MHCRAFNAWLVLLVAYSAWIVHVAAKLQYPSLSLLSSLPCVAEGICSVPEQHSSGSVLNVQGIQQHRGN